MAFYDTNATAVLDEQTTAGDPAAGISGSCSSPWGTIWDGSYYGVQQQPFFIIDLNGMYDLTSVWLYRSWGPFVMDMAVGPTPFDVSANWTWHVGIPGTDAGPDVYTGAGQGWKSYSFTTPVKARYLVATVHSSGANVYEMVIYGKRATDVPAPPRAPPGPPPPAASMGLLLGVNGFATADPATITGITGSFREYQVRVYQRASLAVSCRTLLHAPRGMMQLWGWTEYTPDSWTFQPMVGPGVYLDSWYADMANRSIAVHQCIMLSPGWVNSGANSGWKPLTDAQLATPLAAIDPLQYTLPAAHTFQARGRAALACAAAVDPCPPLLP